MMTSFVKLCAVSRFLECICTFVYFTDPGSSPNNGVCSSDLYFASYICKFAQYFRFAPGLKVISYVGDKDSREDIRNRIREQWDDLNILLTTYEVINTFPIMEAALCKGAGAKTSLKPIR